MPATCWQSVRGRVMRATKLDECGNPVEGPCSTVVSKGFVSIAYAAEISEGDEVEIKNANGELCISDKACDELKWVNLTITFCGVDPDLIGLMTGYQTVLDYAGNAVGNRVGQKILCDGGFALEAWSDIPGQNCAVTGNRLYGYFLAPWVKSAILNSFTIENDGATFEITARTEGGVIMGAKHRDLPLYGVQFHPESVMTEGGYRMLGNWLAVAGLPEAAITARDLTPLITPA